MDDIPVPLPANPVKFMDQLRAFIRSKQLAYRTEKTYCRWVADFIRFHNMKHPKELGQEQVESYLSALAIQRHVAINTQKTAVNALVFLYQKFLNQKLEQIPFTRTGKPRRLPSRKPFLVSAALLIRWFIRLPCPHYDLLHPTAVWRVMITNLAPASRIRRLWFDS